MLDKQISFFVHFCRDYVQLVFPIFFHSNFLKIKIKKNRIFTREHTVGNDINCGFPG